MTLEISLHSSLDQNKLWDCVLDGGSGKPRLSVARQFFNPLNQVDLPQLIEAFKCWREFDEAIVMKATHQITGEEKYFAVKCSKRGNDVFAARLDPRLGFLRADEKFFNPLDFEAHSNKAVKTKLLWVTLTYDSGRSSLHEAWKNISNEFNLWITNLRNKYGKIHYVAFPQAFPDPKGSAYGYPHYHVIMFFEDIDFSVFRHMEKDREGKLGLVFRIEEKSEVEDQGNWHSYIDVKALSSMKAVWNYAKRHCYNAGYGDSDDAILNNAVMWLYKKRSFNMSGQFRKRYTEFITHMHSSKSFQCLFGGKWVLKTKTIQFHKEKIKVQYSELVLRVPIWKFSLLGIYSFFELCIGGKDPPWTVSLDQEAVIKLFDRFKHSR